MRVCPLYLARLAERERLGEGKDEATKSGRRAGTSRELRQEHKPLICSYSRLFAAVAWPSVLEGGEWSESNLWLLLHQRHLERIKQRDSARERE